MLSAIAHLTSGAFVVWVLYCLFDAVEHGRGRLGWGCKLAVLAALGAATGVFFLMR